MIFVFLWLTLLSMINFPGGTVLKNLPTKCRRPKRHGFNPWVRKIPWSSKWQSTLVFLPGESPWAEEFGRLQSMGSHRARHDLVTKRSTVHDNL